MKIRLRGIRFLVLVSFLYLLSILLAPEKGAAAAARSLEILSWILPLFVVVIFFTATVNYLLKPEEIARHLGEGSGMKGWMIALLAGVISHGPMYAWYPMIEDLKRHGLKHGLIATFFYARSLKLPLLPLMVEYFGWPFTIALSVYVLIASLVQGVVIEFLCGDCGEKGE